MAEIDQNTAEVLDQLIRTCLRTEITEPILKTIGANTRVTAEDQLITAPQVAKILHVSPRWLYAHAATLPYTVRLSRTVVRFSRNWIQVDIQRKLKIQG